MAEQLIIERFTFPELEEMNTFIIASMPLGEAMIIDAGGFDERMVEFIGMRNLVIKYLLLTNTHNDNIAAFDSIIENCEDFIIYCGEKNEGPETKIPDEGDNIYLGNLKGTILKVPGNSPKGMVFYLAGHLFTGNCLYAGSIGDTTSEHNYKLLLKSLYQVMDIYESNTVIHPAQGPNSTLELERMFNRFLNEFKL